LGCSIRSMLPRRDASVLVRALLMRRGSLVWGQFASQREPEAGSFVHDMF
jgi:hypothetical protein